jgi:hypothetical protein
MNARDVIRKYGTEYRAPEPPPSGIPASTRIIGLIAEIEKENKQLGQLLTAALFEMKRWVEIKQEERLRADGRLK